MRQLELKDICGYLPYGLRLQNQSAAKTIFDLLGDNCEGVTDLVEHRINVYQLNKYHLNYKLILRPHSDLYTTIIHNGKKIIPIVECAKICYPSMEWRLDPYHNEAICGRQSFSYYKTEKCFTSYQRAFGTTATIRDVTKNEYLLFDYLNYLKIDYRGLIDEGLAISVYDLKKNPYK